MRERVEYGEAGRQEFGQGCGTAAGPVGRSVGAQVGRQAARPGAPAGASGGCAGDGAAAGGAAAGARRGRRFRRRGGLGVRGVGRRVPGSRVRAAPARPRRPGCPVGPRRALRRGAGRSPASPSSRRRPRSSWRSACSPGSPSPLLAPVGRPPAPVVVTVEPGETVWDVAAGSPPDVRERRWRRSPSGSWPTTRSARCAWSPVRCCGWPAADAVRTPAATGVPLVPRSGRHAERWPIRLPLPLHVVVTSLLFAQCLGWSSQEGVVMRCPFCRHGDSRVIDSREVDDGQAIRRRRSCAACGRRFTTVEEAVLAVVKRSGVTEPFSRDKVVSGVRRACQGRPVDEDALAQLAHRVEEAVRAGGAAEIPSHEVGLAILGPLRELDEVAYMRFASVYRSFSSIEDFEKEIADLRRAAAPADVAHTARLAPTRAASPAAAPYRIRTRFCSRSHAYTDRGPPPQGGAAGEGEHDRDRRAPRRRPGRGRKAGRTERRGLTVERVHTTAGRAPLRRGHLAAPRRRDDELARRHGELRAARRGVPGVLVGQRHEHRHQQVLPRRRRLAAARVQPAPAHRPRGGRLPPLRASSTATSPPRTTPRSSPTS